MAAVGAQPLGLDCLTPTSGLIGRMTFARFLRLRSFLFTMRRLSLS